MADFFWFHPVLGNFYSNEWVPSSSVVLMVQYIPKLEFPSSLSGISTGIPLEVGFLRVGRSSSATTSKSKMTVKVVVIYCLLTLLYLCH